MKISFRIFTSPQGDEILYLNLPIRVNQEHSIPKAIADLDGVEYCSAYTGERAGTYRVSIHKGELFRWDQLKADIAKAICGCMDEAIEVEKIEELPYKP